MAVTLNPIAIIVNDLRCAMTGVKLPLARAILALVACASRGLLRPGDYHYRSIVVACLGRRIRAAHSSGRNGFDVTVGR